MLIEKVTGEAYYDLVRNSILKPMQLHDTHPSNARIIENLAVGYSKMPPGFQVPNNTVEDKQYFMNPQLEWTGGGMASTTEDLAKWAKLYYEGHLVSKTSLHAIITPNPNGKNVEGTSSYGMGSFIYDTQHGEAYGHTGFMPGFNAIFIYYPKLGIAAAMQINSEHATPLERIRTALSNAELDTTVSFLPGRNLFLLKDTFARVNGFPEHLLTCEDYYFTGQVSEHGGLYYTSETHYVHLGEDKAFGPMFKKEIWRGQSNIASTSGRPIPLRELPSFIVPFAVTLGLIILLLSLLYSRTNFAIIFSLIAGAPLLAYTLRLKKLVGNDVSFFNCLRFYLVYFPARAIGTLLGARGAVTTNTHK